MNTIFLLFAAMLIPLFDSSGSDDTIRMNEGTAYGGSGNDGLTIRDNGGLHDTTRSSADGGAGDDTLLINSDGGSDSASGGSGYLYNKDVDLVSTVSGAGNIAFDFLTITETASGVAVSLDQTATV